MISPYILAVVLLILMFIISELKLFVNIRLSWAVVVSFNTTEYLKLLMLLNKAHPLFFSFFGFVDVCQGKSFFPVFPVS